VDPAAVVIVVVVLIVVLGGAASEAAKRERLAKLDDEPEYEPEDSLGPEDDAYWPTPSGDANRTGDP
jgi:hypothetical protein